MNVLIIKYGALGDIIIASSVIKQIQDHHQKDNVHLLVSKNFAHLFDAWSDIEVHAVNRSGLINFIKQIIWTRKQRFDLVYDLQSNDRSSILCSLSNIPIKAGNHPRFPYNKHPADEYIGQCHVFNRLNQIIMAIGLMPAQAHASLSIPSTADEKVIKWLSDKNIDINKFIIMHAGSSPQHFAKRWPHFNQLAKRINEKGYSVIWVGTGDEKTLNQSLASITGIDATDEFSIYELIALGNYAELAITNDSAPMHILSCSKTKVIGLFGPTNPRRNHALGHEDNVVFAGGKFPENDNQFVSQSIDLITVNEVMNKISVLIQTN